MQEVTSIKIVPTCVAVACVTGVITLLAAIGMFIGGLVHGHLGAGLFVLLTAPLFIFGKTILGVVISIWLYNLIAPRVGGIQYETAEKKPT